MLPQLTCSVPTANAEGEACLMVMATQLEVFWKSSFSHTRVSLDENQVQRGKWHWKKTEVGLVLEKFLGNTWAEKQANGPQTKLTCPFWDGAAEHDLNDHPGTFRDVFFFFFYHSSKFLFEKIPTIKPYLL